MDVLSLQIFVSLMLVLGSILLFLHAAKGRDHEHADRLSLLPLDAEPARPAEPPVEPPAPPPAHLRGDIDAAPPSPPRGPS